MKSEITGDHPIWIYFNGAIHDSLRTRLGIEESQEIENYLTQMLVDFLHNDAIYAIRDASGRPVRSIAEMMAEGDVRLNADSFDREREVHRHIGDFLLFWSGLFPEYIKNLADPRDALVDITRQGQFSYHVVSTFDHAPYTEEAGTFRTLSERFEIYQQSLNFVRASFDGFNSSWTFGFEA